MKKRYEVRFAHDDDGFWTVTVPAFPGCITQARSIEQGMRRARAALGLLLDDDARVGRMDLVPTFDLDRRTLRLLTKSQVARAAASKAAEVAAAATRTLVDQLVKDVGLSRRDAARLIGVSFQRVHQLAARAS